jgi:hypothetical protein
MKKNVLEERRRAATRTKTVNWVCIGVLALAVVTCSQISLSYVSAYQAAVRLVIGVGATVMVFDAIRTREYGFASLFGALIVLYNPVFPAFAVSRSGPILLASVLPFVGFLIRVRNHERSKASRIAH